MKVLSFFENSLGIKAIVLHKEKKEFTVKEKYFFSGQQAHKECIHWIESSEQLTSLFQVSTIKNSRLFLKKLTFPFSHPSQIKKLLPQELEDILPLGSKEYLTHYFLEKKQKGQKGSEVYIQAISKQSLEEFSSHVIEKQLNPVAIVSLPQALFRFSLSCTYEKDFIAIHDDGNTWSILLIENRKMMGAFFIEKSQAEDQSLWNEIERMFFHFKKTIGKTISIFICMPTGAWMEYEKKLTDGLEISFSHVLINNQSLFNEKSFAIPIGAAIDSLLSNHESVNFYNGFNHKKLITQKILRSALALTMMTLVLIVSLFSSLFIEKNRLEERFALILNGSKELQHIKEKASIKNSFFSDLAQLEKWTNKKRKQNLYSKKFPTPSVLLGKVNKIVKNEHLLLSIDEMTYEIKENFSSSKKGAKEALFIKILFKEEKKNESSKELIEKFFPKEWKEITINHRPLGYEVSFIIE